MSTKKRFLVAMLCVTSIIFGMLPTMAADGEGKPVSSSLYSESIHIPSFPVNPNMVQRSSGLTPRYLGSYTIKQYLADDFMKFTDESFSKDDFATDGTFWFETDLATTGKKTTINAGIAYTTIFGNDKFVCDFTMGLEGTHAFTFAPSEAKDNVKYYGCIDNRTGGFLTGSFAIYALDAG